MMLLPLVNPHEPSVCREDPAPLKASTPVRIRLGAPINQRLNAYRNSPREFHFSGMLPPPAHREFARADGPLNEIKACTRCGPELPRPCMAPRCGGPRGNVAVAVPAL